MAIRLYDASIPTYLQTLRAMSGVLDKGLAHARESGVNPEEIVEHQLAPDMRPFRFQIQSIVFHSVGAIEAIRSGALNMPGQRPAHTYEELQQLVKDACAGLEAIPAEAINAREGQEVVFNTPRGAMLFTAEEFLLSFSLPNFYFHAATAYDILRSRGTPIGKLDFMGRLRLKA